MLRIGLISDTHGLLRPEAVAFLQGSDHIVHGGDIGRGSGAGANASMGGEAILDALRAIAPLTVVRGNNDREPWADAVPPRVEIVLAGVRLLVLHDRADLKAEPPAPGVRVVVSGHSHQPSIETAPDGVLWLNPGSAGPRRFTLPVSVAQLTIDDGRLVPCIELLRI